MSKKASKQHKKITQDVSPPHHHIIAEIAGWAGAISLLSGYLLISNHVITSADISYHLLNLVGAIGLIIIAVTKRIYQSILVNIVWMTVAISAILGSMF